MIMTKFSANLACIVILFCTLALMCKDEDKPPRDVKLHHGAEIQEISSNRYILVLDGGSVYFYFTGNGYSVDYRYAQWVFANDTCYLKQNYYAFLVDSAHRSKTGLLPVIQVDSPVIVIDKKDVFIHSGKGQQHNNTGTGKQIIINK